MRWLGQYDEDAHDLWRTSLFFRLLILFAYILTAVILYVTIDCFTFSKSRECVGNAILLGLACICTIVVSCGVLYWSCFPTPTVISEPPAGKVEVKVLQFDEESFSASNPMTPITRVASFSANSKDSIVHVDSFSATNPMTPNTHVDSASSKSPVARESSKKLSKKSSKRRDSIDQSEAFSVANPILTP